MRANGIYSDIDIEQYHADVGISNSGITEILKCPKLYWYKYLSTNKEVEDNNKYLKGRALHCRVLEPSLFRETYAPMLEKVNLTTIAGKKIYNDFEEDNKGKVILRYDDWKEIEGMYDSIIEHSFWSKLSPGKYEHSVYWTGGTFNSKLRARPDFFNDEVIVDLKSTRSIEQFKKCYMSYGYHTQAAMQIDGLKSLDGKERQFKFFVVEDKAPHLTCSFTLPQNALDLGRKQYEVGAMIYEECIMNNSWPGPSEEDQELPFSPWAGRDFDE